MPLTGIEIFKLLPKTNCRECGVPTCLAFAMNLAAGKAELASCPYVSEEAKAKLEESSAPPIRQVVIGAGEGALKIGGETVMFRHEKRFENPPGIAVLVSDLMEESEINGRLARFKELRYERVGLLLKPELVAINNESGNTDKFASLVQKVASETDALLILMSGDAEALKQAGAAVKDKKPVLYAATKDNVDAMAALAKEWGCPLAVKGEGLEEVSQLTSKLTEAGLKDLIIDSSPSSFRKAWEDSILIRRAALVDKHRPLGFPTIVFANRVAQGLAQETIVASALIAKYAGIVVLSDLRGESLFPLLVERLNIYTDPQRPMATTEGIYEINGPNEDSPVLLTSNFSLTYFIVSGEIENSRVPSWLLVKDTEGLSVMTAWAAGKFSADTIGPFVKKSGIADKVRHRKLVIPGYAAAISGELEEELPDWQILIGPREAAYIPGYLKGWTPS